MAEDITRRKQTFVFSWELFVAVVVNVSAFIYFATMSQAAQDVKLESHEQRLDNHSEALRTISAQNEAIATLNISLARLQEQMMTVIRQQQELKAELQKR